MAFHVPSSLIGIAAALLFSGALIAAAVFSLSGRFFAAVARHPLRALDHLRAERDVWRMMDEDVEAVNACPRDRSGRPMIRYLGRAMFVLTALTILPAPLLAQDEGEAGSEEEEVRFSLNSDRPGLGDGAHVMAPGVWQAELGGQLARDGIDQFSLGQGLVRRGFDAFELRFYANSLVIVDDPVDSSMDFEDLGLGVKVPFGEPGKWNWAVLGLLTVPTGGDNATSGEWMGGATVIGETMLVGPLSFALNAGYVFPFNGVGDGTFAVIVTPGFPIPGVPGVNGYAGVASYLRPGDDANFVEAGLTYSRSADTQVDLNWGVDTDSRGWFLGLGWSRRWR
jgi:hypothetical protein